MGIEATGRIHAIFDTKQVTDRFAKREFVVEMSDNPKYPQVVLFQLTGERVDQLDRFKVGDEVRLDFSLRGREWRSPSGETKYFNSLDVWTVEPAGAARSRSSRGSQAGDDMPRHMREDGPPRRGDDDAPPPRGDARPDLDDIPF